MNFINNAQNFKRLRLVSWLGLIGLLLLSPHAMAFLPTNNITLLEIFDVPVGILFSTHQKITEQAIEELDKEFFGITKLTKPMKEAIKQIVNANAEVDEDMSSGDENTTPSAKHFDGENFAGGQRFVLDNRNLVLITLESDNAAGARTYLGQALHAIQDFYTHTNWIELGNSSPHPQLGVVGATITGTASLFDRTCVDCIRLFPPDCPDCSSNLRTGLLTSGYFGGEDRTKPSPSKCSHGSPKDSSALGVRGEGISKDVPFCDGAPHANLHNIAAILAREATQKFIRELRADLTDSQLKLLLGVGPTLAMAIDTTGSMGSIIAQVKSIATGIVDSRIDTEEEPSKYILVPFNDPGVGPTTVTTDPNQFKAAINALSAFGGGDCPELSITGTLRALAASEERGTLFMFTDASSKDASLVGVVASLAAQKKVKTFFQSFGSCSPIDPAYFQIVEESGGQLFELFRSEAGKVTQLADFLVRSNAVDVLSVAKPSPGGTAVEHVPVDSTLTAVTFSVSGTPAVTLKRPDGSVVGVTDPGVSFVSLSKGSIYRVQAPVGGAWTLELAGSDSYSVMVSGESDLDLDAFRFVERGGRPGHEGLFSIAGLPTEGESNTVVATMSGAFGSPVFELRAKDGTLLAVLPLSNRPGDERNEFSGDVVLPSQPFLVYVRGLDEHGLPYQRVMPSRVTPQTVKISQPSPKSLPIGDATNYLFTVTNLGAEGDFRFTGSDDQSYLSTISPSIFHLGTNESIVVTVMLQVPAFAVAGTPDTLTVNVESLTSTARNVAVVNSTVVEQSADTSPPVIASLTADPNVLWPPNHRMRTVSLGVEVSDDQDPAPVCEIMGVTSNEPINGLGDGSTSADWEVPDPSLLDLRLRAERAGGGSGRMYTVTIACMDFSGNTATATVEVTVPHNR